MKTIKPAIFLHLSIITTLVLIIWHKVLNQGFWADGFFFFNPLFRTPFPPKTSVNNYDNMAFLLNNILMSAFKGNIILYQFFEIVILAVIGIILYFLTTKLTKNRTMALIASIIFISNYGGIYEMIAQGNFNRFLERMPNLIVLLSALFLLFVYLENKKIIALVLSYFVFTLGIYLGHYATFIFPFFAFSSIIFSFNSKEFIKSLLTGIGMAGLFAGIDFLIIQHSNQRSGYSLLYYLNPQLHYFEKIFLMITPLVVPQELVTFLAKNFPGGPIPNPYVQIVLLLTIPVVISTIIIGIYLFKKNTNLFKIYLSCVLSIIVTTGLTIYTDPIKYNPLKDFGAGRQLFTQSIFYAIALAIVAVTLLKKFKRLYIPILVTFVSIFVVYNTYLSWQMIDANQYLYEGYKKYFSYIKSLYPKFNSDTVVVVGTNLVAGSGFINDFYGPPVVNFASSEYEIRNALNLDKNNTYVIDLSYEKDAEGNFINGKDKIIDLTNLYREGRVDLLKGEGKPGNYFLILPK